MIVEYTSNNSGGEWWLDDNDWINLEKAGWKIAWVGLDFDYKDGNFQQDDEGFPKMLKIRKVGERWLGGLAKIAFYKCNSIEEAIKSFEDITGEYANSVGCECCGRPHSFYEVNYK